MLVRGKCSYVASRARAAAKAVVLHLVALNNHAYKSHLHFPAAGLRRGAAGAVLHIALVSGGGDRLKLLTPGHGDTGFIYERVLAWNVWQANKYVKVRARRANVNMTSFLRHVIQVRCPYINHKQIM